MQKPYIGPGGQNWANCILSGSPAHAGYAIKQATSTAKPYTPQAPLIRLSLFVPLLAAAIIRDIPLCPPLLGRSSVKLHNRTGINFSWDNVSSSNAARGMATRD